MKWLYNLLVAVKLKLVFSIAVEVVGELEKNSPSLRPDHFVVFQVNDRDVFRSKKKCRIPTPSWQEDHQL